MIALCRAAVSGDRTGADTRPMRILDPACGDGAFVLALYDELAGGPQARRLGERGGWQIVRDQLFGIDIDRQAVERLRARLRDRVAVTAEDRAAWDNVLAANFRVGDALASGAWGVESGESMGTSGQQLDLFKAASAGGERTAESGFDLVIGNPPYRREKDARELFARLAATPLGRRYSQARMDLWHYFMHLGLDLLRPEGELCFIVNSYWTASAGASKLVRRLEKETTLLDIVQLDDAAVFAGVAGRHMIVRLERHRVDTPCRVVDSRGEYTLPRGALFHGTRICLARESPQAVRCEVRSGLVPLRARFLVRQGIAENPPCITPHASRASNGLYPPGAGVFVLSTQEVSALTLSGAEKELLRPYFETRHLGRYRIPQEPRHWLLYLTRRTAPTLDGLSAIASHLERYRPLLEGRREVLRGRCGWWHLHWPRDESLFTRPRVLSVQMGRLPQFVTVREPTFVGFSVNLIVAAADDRSSPHWLAGVLNSSAAREWFERHAKRRGANLEINVHLLNEFPLPHADAQREARLAELVSARQASEFKENLIEKQCLDADIDALVDGWYGGT